MIALVGLCLAGSVYINGVRADEPPAMSFENVDVRIDSAGNVYVDAPGYQVQVIGGASPAAVSAPASLGQWYLVSEDEGSTGGIVDVYVNDQFVRRLQSGGTQVLVDLSSVVRPGPNTVQFVVRQAPTGRLAAYVGVGREGGGGLQLDAPAVTWRSLGAPATQKMTFEAK